MPQTLPQSTAELRPSGMRFWLDTRWQSFVSPLTRSEQRQRLAAIWKAELVWDGMEEADAHELLAFLDSINDEEFYMRHPVRRTPRSGYSGNNGAVYQGSQTGTTLVVDGWSAATSLFKRGDYIMLAGLSGSDVGQVFEVTADCSSSGPSDQVPISVTPYIRTSPVDNCVVKYGEDVLFTMVLEKPVIPDWSPPAIVNFSAEMKEALFST